MKHTILTLAAALAMTVPAVADSLSAYRWSHRPLLVFSPDEAGEAVRRQLASLDDAMAGLVERDMAVMAIPGADGAPRMLAGPAPAGTDNAALRRDYGVEPEDFTVILVGKDGGEKRRWSAPVAPGTIFSVIDAMPMRAREMRQER